MPAPATTRRVGWVLHLLLMAALPLSATLAGVGRSPGHGPVLSHSASGLITVCAFQLGFFAVIFGLAWLASHATVDDLLLRWRQGFWVAPLGLGYSIALRLGLGIIGMLVYAMLLATRVVSPAEVEHFSKANAPDVGALVDITALGHDPVYMLLTLTLVSFAVGGLREELWRSAFLAPLRRLWPRAFAGRPGEIRGVVLASIIFGAAHIIQGPVAMVMIGLLGLGLGLIIVFHRSIWPAVIAHGFFDATSMALLPWAMQGLQKFQQTTGH